jgi:hypothetical protein
MRISIAIVLLFASLGSIGQNEEFIPSDISSFDSLYYKIETHLENYYKPYRNPETFYPKVFFFEIFALKNEVSQIIVGPMHNLSMVLTYPPPNSFFTYNDKVLLFYTWGENKNKADSIYLHDLEDAVSPFLVEDATIYYDQENDIYYPGGGIIYDGPYLRFHISNNKIDTICEVHNCAFLWVDPAPFSKRIKIIHVDDSTGQWEIQSD